MNQETKDKIERMAEDNKELYGIDFSTGMHKGATPWAEWCERFEGYLAENCECIEGTPDDNFETDVCGNCIMLGEYRQWLEQK